jgi:hypothetical protein
VASGPNYLPPACCHSFSMLFQLCVAGIINDKDSQVKQSSNKQLVGIHLTFYYRFLLYFCFIQEIDFPLDERNQEIEFDEPLCNCDEPPISETLLSECESKMSEIYNTILQDQV